MLHAAPFTRQPQTPARLDPRWGPVYGYVPGLAFFGSNGDRGPYTYSNDTTATGYDAGGKFFYGTLIHYWRTKPDIDNRSKVTVVFQATRRRTRGVQNFMVARADEYSATGYGWNFMVQDFDTATVSFALGSSWAGGVAVQVGGKPWVDGTTKTIVAEIDMSAATPTVSVLLDGQWYTAAAGSPSTIDPGQTPLADTGRFMFGDLAQNGLPQLSMYGTFVLPGINRSRSNELARNMWALLQPPSVLDRLLMGGGGAPLATILRPNGDVLTAGWTATPGPNFYSAVNESSPDDASFLTSPVLSVGAAPVVLQLNATLPAGTDHIVRVRAKTAGTGTLKVTLLDDSNVAQGSTASQAITSTLATYAINLTTTGPATRLQLAVEP